MKTITLVLVSHLLLSACSKDQAKSGLIGKWQLTEVFSDPGNGSGSYQLVSSDKTLEFLADGSLTSNGSICEMSIASNSPSSGVYSLSDSTLSSITCANATFKIHFKKRGSNLFVYYPCFEGCAAKYVKK